MMVATFFAGLFLGALGPIILWFTEKENSSRGWEECAETERRRYRELLETIIRNKGRVTP